MPRRRTPPQAEYDPRTVKQNIVDTPLQKEMDTSFLAYAYSVIYSRALPDARDGLKPVQRRIIYQMGEMHLTPDRPYMKSARAVGEVMGKLHPHGDSSIYEAMVRLAQPFAMRLPLVDGHGNFGSLDDGPAASRYTEARLAPAALAMNADIHEGTVPFSPNYDNKLTEPDVLPAAIPNLLVNGSQGIAVGMATNMVTHNLREVIHAAKDLMRHPDLGIDDLMKDVPGPDLPGGGIIMGREGIRQAYRSGRGSFVTRARVHVENVTARKKGIVVTELPYMVGPERVLERIGQAVKERKLDGISDAVDLSDRTNGLKMVITIKTGFDPAAVLAQLYKTTPLESSFTINNVALVDGRPHTLSLKSLLEVWIDHRRTVVTNRSRFRRQKADERLHIVEGLLLALVDIDEAIRIIRNSDNEEVAKKRLMAVFSIDDVQAGYILDLRLRRLTKLSEIKLKAERDDLRKQIASLDEILSSESRRDQVVMDEMDDAARRFGDGRRTLIYDEDGSLAAHRGDSLSPASSAPAPGTRDLSTIDTAQVSQAVRKADTAADALQLEDTPCAVVLGADGLIARMPAGTLDLLSSRDASTPRAAHDAIRSAFASTTRSQYGLLTSAGRVVLAHVSDLPLLHPGATVSLEGGVNADELLAGTSDTKPVAGEKAIAAIPLGDEAAAKAEGKPGADGSGAAGGVGPFIPLAMGTRFGVVKRWNGDRPTTMDSFQAITLKTDAEGEMDQVVGAAPAGDDDCLVFITSSASLLAFPASEVRAQGRTSAGMKGVSLEKGAHVVCFAVVRAGDIAWTAGAADGSYEVDGTDLPDEAGDASSDGSHPADGSLSSASGAVVLTVAGDAEALAGTEPGCAKVTPLDMYPTKGRGTRGVRAQRFLKGQNALLLAAVGPYPLHALDTNGDPVVLPDPDMRRDGSGTNLETVIGSVC